MGCVEVRSVHSTESPRHKLEAAPTAPNSNRIVEGEWPPSRGASAFNLPAGAVSLDDAKGYAKWLSEQTGQTWRMPYEDEVSRLYEHRENENTLDYWAGYAPN